MTRPVIKRTCRTPIPRNDVRTPALLAARVVGRSTYAGTSAVTMNHRQMAGRLQNASRGTSADQLAQSNHSGAQSLACRNIHCFSDATAAKQCLHATTDGAPGS